MAKARESEIIEVKVHADVWIQRLTDMLRIVNAMEPDERSASLTFLKSKYRSEWPSENY